MNILSTKVRLQSARQYKKVDGRHMLVSEIGTNFYNGVLIVLV